MNRRLLYAGLLALLAWGANASSDEMNVLPQCNQCVDPSIVSKSGLGTANAVITAKTTRQDVVGWCANWQPGDKDCVKSQATEIGQTYTAKADCLHGKITSSLGESYTYGGIWSDDIGKGRSKWRDKDGKVVGQDNASGGLTIATQWEMLCPGPLKFNPSTLSAGAAARSAVPASKAAPVASASAAQPKATAAAARTARTPAVCAGDPLCTEVNDFATTVTDFRTSQQGRYKVITANLRFQNKLDHPLILGYVSGSGIATDDQGNRYSTYNDSVIRGIGVITSRNVDPKFVLQPGETSDARIELVWKFTQAVFGTNFLMEMTVREIDPIQGDQYRLGSEHALQFRGLTNNVAAAIHSAGATTAVPSTTPVSAASANEEPAAPVVSNACANLPRCFGAGPFTAEVTGVNVTQNDGRRHSIIRLNIRFHNVSGEPIILGYVSGSSIATDNQGTRYGWGVSGTHDTSVQGMPILEGRSYDTQFVLRPGESRNAAFTVYRKLDNSILGTSYTYDVTIAQLRILENGVQVTKVRDYALNFQNLTATAGGGQSIGNTAKSLADLFKKKN